MILAFVPRLICLVLACFVLIYGGGAVTVALCSHHAIRAAQSLRSRSAERLLLVLRLLPFGLAAVAAPALVVPSYLWFEPARVDERVSILCMLLAGVGAVTVCFAGVRAFRAGIRSLLFARRCGKPTSEPFLVIESERPFLALAGIVRPQVIISRSVAEALSVDQLGVVLSHELAHRASRDNLKRLMMSFTPGFRALELAWARFAEYAADDDAVAGDKHRSLALASALVRVARFGSMQSAAVSVSFLSDPGDLTARVGRLLTLQQRTETASTVRWQRSASLALLVCVGGIVLQPGTMRAVQSILEGLVR